MRFSVVMPLFNKQDFVAETLRSVLNQTFKDFQVLCVDDGSTDDGPNIVQAMNDPRVELIRQKNAGVSAARNTGIQHARGDWVAFLDADDLWAPDYLAEQNAAIRLYPEVDMVATRFYASEDLGEWARSPPEGNPSGKIEWIFNLPARWHKGGSFFTSSVAVRRKKLMVLQPCFTVGDSNGEDLELWFRLSEITPIVLTLNALVGYRLATPGSLSLAQRPGMPPYLERMRMRAQTGRMVTGHRTSSLRFVAHHEISLARDCMAANDRAGGLEWLGRSFWRGVGIRRWWVTLGLAVLPGPLIGRLNAWRVRLGNTRNTGM